MNYLGFSTNKVMSSANRDSFTSSPIWMAFISFACLIVLTKTSSTMLNRNSEEGYLFVYLFLEVSRFLISNYDISYDFCGLCQVERDPFCS